MTTIATGINKQVRYKEESSPGTFAGASGAQLLRRVTSNMVLNKAKFTSNEIRDDQQVVTMRHGMRRVEGTLACELSFGTYQSFFEALLRKAAASVANITSLTLTVAEVSTNVYTITRSTGSWISDGVRIGMTVRVTAGLNASSLNKNCLVTDLTALIMTVYVLNRLTLVEESGVSSCTVAVPGKNIIVPSTGHIDRSYSIEELNTDLSPVISRTFLGCRVMSGAVKLPATGLATADFSMIGLDQTLAAAEAFSSPTAAGTSEVAIAVNGAIILDGAAVGFVTGLNFTMAGGHTLGEAVGSNVSPDVFEGRVSGEGQLTAYLQDDTFLDAFASEVEVAIAMTLLSGSSGNADFMTFWMPRVKVSGATPDDGEKGLIITAPFDILKKPTTTGYDSTTMMIHDSTFA